MLEHSERLVVHLLHTPGLDCVWEIRNIIPGCKQSRIHQNQPLCAECKFLLMIEKNGLNNFVEDIHWRNKNEQQAKVIVSGFVVMNVDEIWFEKVSIDIVEQ